jgi:uncharacterized protein (DUF433 family)
MPGPFGDRAGAHDRVEIDPQHGGGKRGIRRPRVPAKLLLRKRDDRRRATSTDVRCWR